MKEQNRKVFEETRMEIYNFSFQDVITTSSGGVDGFDVEDGGLNFNADAADGE